MLFVLSQVSLCVVSNAFGTKGTWMTWHKMSLKKKKQAGENWHHHHWYWSLSLCSVLSEASLWFRCSFAKPFQTVCRLRTAPPTASMPSRGDGTPANQCRAQRERSAGASLMWAAFLRRSSRFCLREKQGSATLHWRDLALAGWSWQVSYLTDTSSVRWGHSKWLQDEWEIKWNNVGGLPSMC